MGRKRRERKRRKVLKRTAERLTAFAAGIFAEFAGSVIADWKQRRKHGKHRQGFESEGSRANH